MRTLVESRPGPPFGGAAAVAAAHAAFTYCHSHDEVTTSLDELGFAVIADVLTVAELEVIRSELARLQDEESFLTGGNEFTPWQHDG